MDAERLANANKTDESGFNYDNPLLEKKPKTEEEAETKTEEAPATEPETNSEAA